MGGGWTGRDGAKLNSFRGTWIGGRFAVSLLLLDTRTSQCMLSGRSSLNQRFAKEKLKENYLLKGSWLFRWSGGRLDFFSRNVQAPLKNDGFFELKLFLSFGIKTKKKPPENHRQYSGEETKLTVSTFTPLSHAHSVIPVPLAWNWFLFQKIFSCSSWITYFLN